MPVQDSKSMIPQMVTGTPWCPNGKWWKSAAVSHQEREWGKVRDFKMNFLQESRRMRKGAEKCSSGTTATLIQSLLFSWKEIHFSLFLLSSLTFNFSHKSCYGYCFPATDWNTRKIMSIIGKVQPESQERLQIAAVQVFEGEACQRWVGESGWWKGENHLKWITGAIKEQQKC